MGDYAKDFEFKNEKDEKKRYHNTAKDKISILLWLDADKNMNPEALQFTDKLAEEHKDDIAVMAVSHADKAKTDKLCQDKKVKLKPVIDTDKKIAGSYKVRRTPTILLVDKEKKIRGIYSGFNKFAVEDINRDLKALIRKGGQ